MKSRFPSISLKGFDCRKRKSRVRNFGKELSISLHLSSFRFRKWCQKKSPRPDFVLRNPFSVFVHLASIRPSPLHTTVSSLLRPPESSPSRPSIIVRFLFPLRRIPPRPNRKPQKGGYFLFLPRHFLHQKDGTTYVLFLVQFNSEPGNKGEKRKKIPEEECDIRPRISSPFPFLLSDTRLHPPVWLRRISAQKNFLGDAGRETAGGGWGRKR